MRNSTPCSPARKATRRLASHRTTPGLCRERQAQGPFHFHLAADPQQARAKILPVQAGSRTDHLEILVVVEEEILSFAAGPQAAIAPIFHGVDDHCRPQPAFRNEFFGYGVVRFGVSLRIHHAHFTFPRILFGFVQSPRAICLLQRRALKCIRSAKAVYGISGTWFGGRDCNDSTSGRKALVRLEFRNGEELQPCTDEAHTYHPETAHSRFRTC